MDAKTKELLRREAELRGIVFEQKEEKSNNFVELISMLLHSRTQIHVQHLQTTSFAEHKAMNDYYDGIVGLIDGLVESYQGKHGIIKGYKSYDIVEYKSGESTVKYLTELCHKVVSVNESMKDSYIKNQLDEVCELLNSTLYKLRFLK